MELPARRLLLVHAHPDDETITTGATMARYAAEGVAVTLITCTRGEEGEVIPEELAHLTADREDRLGEHRENELAAAMTALGVTDHRFLGAPHRRWRDSGMMGAPTNDRPDCFWRADPDEAADALVAVVREVRPQVLVTYDENGGYGHPDHIQAHRVALRAVERAADPDHRPDLGPAWSVAKTYYTCASRSRVAAGLERLRAAAEPPFDRAVELDESTTFVVDDVLVTAEVDGEAHLGAKAAAMRAHATQIRVDGSFFALSNHLGQPILGMEGFRLVRGEPGPTGPDGREDDLFAGIV